MKIPEVFSTGFLIDGERYFWVSEGYCEKTKQLETSYCQVSKALCGNENATLEELLQEVNQVKSRLAQVEREKDAAVADLNKLGAGCEYCAHFKEPCMSCCCGDNWQWRGVCPENTKEQKA